MTEIAAARAAIDFLILLLRSNTHKTVLRKT